MIQKRLIVKGYVQGVGYRAYVCSTARWLKIKGTVKNLSNGNVEIICQCNDINHLEKFKNEIELKGTDRYSANIEVIEIENISNRKLGYFDVDYGGDVANKEIATKIDIGSLVMRSIKSNIDTLHTKYGSLDNSLKRLVEIFENDYEVTLKSKKKKK